MKLTKEQLRRMIKEELRSMNEYGQYGIPTTPGVNWAYDPYFVKDMLEQWPPRRFDDFFSDWDHEFSLSEEASKKVWDVLRPIYDKLIQTNSKEYVAAHLENIYNKLAKELFPEEFKACPCSQEIRESKQNK